MAFRTANTGKAVLLALAMFTIGCSDESLSPELGHSRGGLEESPDFVFPDIVQPTTAAGNTPTQFTVTNTGSPAYRIPISTPPGVGAIAPSLAMTYGANGGIGQSGMGWSLSGLSFITRCRETYDLHTRPRAVTLSTADRFCLDGQPLKLIQGTYGQPNAVYGTELESFTRVTATGSGSASTFTAKMKNGVTYTYGGGANSRQLANGEILKWAVSEVADPSGNRMTFQYSDPGALFFGIMRIDYGMTAVSATPLYQIYFSYSSGRADDPVGYVGGSQVNEPYVLLTVTVREAESGGNFGALIRSYSMGHDINPTTQRTRLRIVQECSETKCLEPIRIAYEPGGAQGFPGAALNAPAGQPGCGVYSPDLNGDGRSDIVWSPYETPGALSCKWKVRFATATGYSTDVPLTAAGTNPLTPPMFGIFSPGIFTQVLLAIPSQGDGNLGAGGYNLFEYDVASNSFLVKYIGFPPIADTLVDHVGDYDGDGFADLFSLEKSGNVINLYLRRNTSTATSTSFSPTWSLLISFNGAPQTTVLDDFRTADFNGDGMTDFVWTVRRICAVGCPKRTEAFVSNGAPNGVVAPPTSVGVWQVQTHVADVGVSALANWNRDGCTDLVTYESTTSAPTVVSKVWVSNCKNGFVNQTTLPTSLTALNGIVTLDYNGDGLDDLVFHESIFPGTSPRSTTYYVIKSTGTGSSSLQSTGIVLSAGAWMALATDQNGDGLWDLAVVPHTPISGVRYTPVSAAMPSVYLRPTAPAGRPLADLATSFTDGFGNVQNVSYSNFNDSSVYTKGLGSVWPERDLTGGALQLVSRVDASDGIGGTYSLWYQYALGRSHAYRGFENFRTFSVKDSRTNSTAVETFEQLFPRTGMVIDRSLFAPNSTTQRLTRFQATPATTVTRNTESPNAFDAAETRYAPLLQDTTETSFEFGGAKNGQQLSKTVMTLHYDAFDNVDVSTTDVTDLDNTAPASPFFNQLWRTVVESTYTNAPAQGCIGLPLAVTTTRTAPGKPSVSRRVENTNNAAKCRTEVSVSQPAIANQKITTSFGFDACGNTNSTSVVGSDFSGAALPARTASANFGSRCQLPETQYNAYNQATTTVYNYKFGVPSSMTGIDGVTTSWQQDEFGRTQRETRPDGTYTTLQYTSQGSGLSTSAKAYDSNNVLITEKVKVTDSFGRVLTTSSTHALDNGAFTVDSAATYDALGRVIRQKRPYRGSTNNGSTTTDYDIIGRPTAVRLRRADDSVERQTTSSYLGRTVSVTDPLLHTTTRVTDVAGNLRGVTAPSPGGTSLYEYDSWANVTRVEDAIHAVSSTTFDELGHKTRSIDADTGTTTYEVNSLGEVTASTNASARRVEWLYDLMGREVGRKADGVQTHSFTYENGTGKNAGKILVEDGFGVGSYIGYSYDSLGRRTARSMNTSVPNLGMTGTRVFAHGWSYNAQGLPDTYTYPVAEGDVSFSYWGLTVKYVYDKGELVEILNNANQNSIWRLQSTNDFGAPTLEQIGLGAGRLSIVRGYKTLTNELASATATRVSDGSLVQQKAYTWDVAGNLKTRSDAVPAAYLEDMTYDALDRLETVKLNGSNRLTMGYNAGGNVTARSTVGFYAYGDPAHPHAATTAGVDSFTYDAAGNMVTRNAATHTWSAAGRLTSIVKSPPSAPSVPVAPQIQNPSFEDPVVTTSQNFPVSDPQYGWTATNNSGAHRTGLGGPAPVFGQQSAFLKTGAMTQTVAFPAEAAMYRLRFKYSRAVGPTPLIHLTVNDATTVGSWNPPSSTSWADGAGIFSVAGTATLNFRNVGSTTSFIDGLTIETIGYPTTTDFSFENSTSGWAFSNGSAVTEAGAPEGAKVAQLNGGGTVSAPASRIYNAGKYVVRFRARRLTGGSTTDSLTANVSGSPTTFVPSTTDFGTYTTNAVNLPATTTALTIAFANGSTGTAIAQIDDVRLLKVTGGEQTTFAYGPDDALAKQVNEGLNETTTYDTDFEFVQTATERKYRYYVATPSGATVLVTRDASNGCPNGTCTITNNYSSVLKDHLGTVERIVDQSGAVTLDSNFEAFGLRRRNDWTTPATTADMQAVASTTREGFTGHRGIDNVGLIHMQGRVYDPTLARFLSADPVMKLSDTQGANPYTYVRNNPFSRIDPTGYTDIPLPAPGAPTIVIGDFSSWLVPYQSSYAGPPPAMAFIINGNRDLTPGFVLPGVQGDMWARMGLLSDPIQRMAAGMWGTNSSAVEQRWNPLGGLGFNTDSYLTRGLLQALGDTKVRINLNGFVGRTAEFKGVKYNYGFAFASGAVFSKNGIGRASHFMFSSPVFSGGISYADDGSGTGDWVTFKGINPPFVSFQDDDAFLGPNVGANFPGVGGINVGEEGVAVWRSFIGRNFSAKGFDKGGKGLVALGVGVGVSNPRFWSWVGPALEWASQPRTHPMQQP